ncbi:unnamed protein product, partial [Timema podura]|nr:unnamed protein product [Timema podura]
TTDKHVRTLGISDLQWTLQFLKGVRNKQGEYPKDVQALIDTIQDQLIEQYASMTTQIPDKQHGLFLNLLATVSDLLASSTDEESSDKTILDLSRILQTPSTPHLDESIYHDATDELPHVSTPIRKTAPFTFDTLEPSPIRYTSIVGNSVYRSCSMGREDGWGGGGLPPYKALSMKTRLYSIDLACCRKTGYAKSPVGTDTSVTYAELMEHWPANSSTCDQPKPTEPCPKHETKTDSTTAKDKGPVVPEEEMVRFLMEWHDERINKIKEELSSLHNIEKFITNIDPTARPKTLDGQPFKKT